MATLFLIAVLFLLWIFIGGVVWLFIDYEDNRLLRWYEACPPEISFFVQPLILCCWPIGLFLRLKARD